LIRAGTTGQLKGVVSDSQLKKMLEQFSEDGTGGDLSGGGAKKKVVVQRKKTSVDNSDDDDDDSDLL